MYSYNTQIYDSSLYWLGSFRAQTFNYIDGEMSHNKNNTDKVPSNDIINKGWTDLSWYFCVPECLTINILRTNEKRNCSFLKLLVIKPHARYSYIHPERRFPTPYVTVICLFDDWRWHVVVHFVNVGWIVDHHCWNILFIVPEFIHVWGGGSHYLIYGRSPQ
jgi:hypothetical protein